VERRRYLFVPTDSEWVAYFDNGWRGTDAASVVSSMAQKLKCEGLRVVAVEDGSVYPGLSSGGAYGASIFELYGPNNTDFLNYIRTIACANDGGRWVFHQGGTPFPFEDQTSYRARRIRDRFPLSLLRQYLGELHVRAFEEGFYMPPGSNAVLIEKVGTVAPNVREYNLSSTKPGD